MTKTQIESLIEFDKDRLFRALSVMSSGGVVGVLQELEDYQDDLKTSLTHDWVLEFMEKRLPNPPGLATLPKLDPISTRLKVANNKSALKVQTGYPAVDDSITSLRSGKSYLVAGNEKSGKSFFLMNIANHLMFQQGIKIGFVDTELTETEFSSRMAAIYHHKSVKEAEENEELRTDWLEVVNDQLVYANKTNLEQGTNIFDHTLSVMETMVISGAKVIFFDNVTSFMAKVGPNEKGYEPLAKMVTKLIRFAEEKNIVLLYVIHTKPTNSITETPQYLKKLTEDDPNKIFDETITIVKKPSLTDVYGGGLSNSQITGGVILIWRPFQKFALQEYQQKTMVILESFRNGIKTPEIRMDFNGPDGSFKPSKATIKITPGGISAYGQD